MKMILRCKERLYFSTMSILFTTVLKSEWGTLFKFRRKIWTKWRRSNDLLIALRNKFNFMLTWLKFINTIHSPYSNSFIYILCIFRIYFFIFIFRRTLFIYNYMARKILLFSAIKFRFLSNYYFITVTIINHVLIASIK